MDQKVINDMAGKDSLNDNLTESFNILLKTVSSAHIKEVAGIHCLAFPESVWTKLGEDIVEKFYLSHLHSSHHMVQATGAFYEGGCVGFCFSGIYHLRVSGFISKNRNAIAMRLAIKPWLLFDPLFFRKLKRGVHILKRFSDKKQSLADQKNVPHKIKSFGVLVIAVLPDYQRFGIGKLLIKDAEEKALKLGFKQMNLKVNTDNYKGINFYENLSWEREFVNQSWDGLMIKKL